MKNIDVIFEFTKIGNYVKVSAIDVTTGIEAVLNVPAQLSQKQIENFALKRLKMLLKRSEDENDPSVWNV